MGLGVVLTRVEKWGDQQMSADGGDREGVALVGDLTQTANCKLTQ